MNDQKEFTLEEVKKMTLEEFRQLPPEQKVNFTQEQRAEIKNKMAREERLIKRQIELGAKDDFKDNVDNDACLQHLTDTFGSRK